MSNKDIFSFNPFKKDIDEQLDTPINNAGIMSKDVSSTVGPMGEQMDDSYDPLSFVDRFSKDLVSLFDTEESKEKFKNTYMDDIVPVKKTAKDKVLDEFVVDYNEAFERGRSLQETMNTIETLPLLPIGTEGVLQSPAPVSRRVKSAPASSPRRVKSAPASSPQPVLSAPAPQRRPRGLMEDDYVYTTLPQFRSGMTDPDSYEEGEGESSLFETIRAEVDNFSRDFERIKKTLSDIGGAEADNFSRDFERIKNILSDIGEALIPSAAAAEATSVDSSERVASDTDFTFPELYTFGPPPSTSDLQGQLTNYISPDGSFGQISLEKSLDYLDSIGRPYDPKLRDMTPPEAKAEVERLVAASFEPVMVGNLQVTLATRAHPDFKTNSGGYNISLDYNGFDGPPTSGTEIIVADSLLKDPVLGPQIRKAGKKFNELVAAFAKKHGVKKIDEPSMSYPIRQPETSGVKMKSESGGGVSNTIHLEAFFGNDAPMEQAVFDNMDEFAAIIVESFQDLPEGFNLIAPHGAIDGTRQPGADRGATTAANFGSETAFGRTIIKRIQEIYGNP
jgi:hypothetical protein